MNTTANDELHDDRGMHDDVDLATRFSAARTPIATGATEADLGAVHARARQVQRRRVLGGTAAAGLLVVGGGALALTGGSSGQTITADATAGAPLVERESVAASASGETPSDAAQPDGNGTATPVDEQVDGDDDVPTPVDDVPTPAVPLPDLAEVPLPDLPPLPEPGPDGTTDWDAYVAELGRSLETWVEELSTWIEANPEATTFLDLVGPLDGTLGGVDLGDVGDWSAKLDELAELFPVEGVDLDNWGDDWTGDWQATLDRLGLDLDDWRATIEEWSVDLDDADLDEWNARADQWRAELDQLDLDRWLAELDLSNLDALGEFEFPDLDLSNLDALSEFEFPDLDLSNLDEVDLDRWLDELGVDLSDVDLSNLDLGDLDLGDLDLGDLDLGDLDLSDLGGLFGG